MHPNSRFRDAPSREVWSELVFRSRSDTSTSTSKIEDFYHYYAAFAKQSPLVEELDFAPFRLEGLPKVAILDEPIGNAEVISAVGRIQNSFSSGMFPIAVNIFKSLVNHSAFLCSFALILNFVYSVAAIPEEWSRGTVCPVPNPNKPIAVENCRPIAITPLPIRILSSILAKGLKRSVPLNDDQLGFRTVRCTADALFVLQSLCEAAIFGGGGALRFYGVY